MNSSQTSSTSTKSSSTTSRVAKTSSSQRVHHVSSSSTSTQSSATSSGIKAIALQRDLNDMQNTMSEIKTLAAIPPPHSVVIGDDLEMPNSSLQAENFDLGRLHQSLENIVDEEPLVTFPDESPTSSLELSASQLGQLSSNADNELVAGNHLNTTDTVKFEEKRTMSASKMKVIKDGFSSEKASFFFFYSLIN